MNLEKKIQKHINSTIFHGQEEVVNTHGRVDILTTTRVIELKEASKYKHGIGQLLAYKKFYPAHDLVLVSFGTMADLEKYRARAKLMCSDNNVKYGEVQVGFKALF